MKLSRSILSLTLALVLVFSLGAGVFAADWPESGFVDVPRNQWYAAAVDYVKAEGLMNGVGDNRFDPNGAVTRAMVATVLYRVVGQPDVKGKTCPFVDVPVGEWFFNAIIWAADVGVTNGTDESHFSPFQPITREQLAAMIMRYALTTDPASQKKLALAEQMDRSGSSRRAELTKLITDAEDVSLYALTSVLFCKQSKIMNGDSAGTFRPQATLSRAECAQTFLNLSKIEASVLGR